VVLCRLIVIGKHGVQHVSGQALESLVSAEVSRRLTGWSQADGEASILVQDHASAIFQRHELAYREVLGTRVVGALGPEIADGAKAYDATWLDGGETIRAATSSVRVRVPATLHTAQLRTPERPWPRLRAFSQPRQPGPRHSVTKRSQSTRGWDVPFRSGLHIHLEWVVTNSVGDRVVMFLQTAPDGSYSTVGALQGSFVIRGNVATNGDLQLDEAELINAIVHGR
jgi:hypothetical protein